MKEKKRILGIDYGLKKVGLAISDSSGELALPLTIIINQGKEKLLAELKAICREHQVEKIVVGLPLSFAGNKENGLLRQKDLANKQLQTILLFVDWLKDNIDLPLEVEDERLSTKLANHLSKDLIKKGPDDAVAAMLILQSYLDKQNNF